MTALGWPVLQAGPQPWLLVLRRAPGAPELAGMNAPVSDPSLGHPCGFSWVGLAPEPTLA